MLRNIILLLPRNNSALSIEGIFRYALDYCDIILYPSTIIFDPSIEDQSVIKNLYTELTHANPSGIRK